MEYRPIAEVVKERRDTLKYSLRRMEALTGVSYATVWDVEHGKLPLVLTLEAIMKPLGEFEFQVIDGVILAREVKK